MNLPRSSKVIWAMAAPIAVLIAGCSRNSPSPIDRSAGTSPRVAAPADKWLLTCLDSNDTTPALLWNGLIGLRLGRDSSAKGQPFFSIDEYDTNGEEKIRPLQNPLPNGFLVDGKPLSITGGYRQSLDMRTSELKTQWESGKLKVECLTVISPTAKVVGEQWILQGLQKDQTLDFDLGPSGSMGTQTTLSKTVVVGRSGMRGKFQARRRSDGRNTVEFVLALEDSPNLARILEARGAKIAPNLVQRKPLSDPADFASVDSEAKKVWAERWKTDIEIDGPVEDQQAVHSFLFYLRSAIQHDHAPSLGDISISPFGLSNQMYNGHVFWDADIWVFPALELIDPAAARVIANYRTGGPGNSLGNIKTPSGDVVGIKYPWESSVTGNETVPGPSRQELHISGDVAWMLSNAGALDLLDGRSPGSVLSGIDAYFRSIAKPNPTTGELTLANVMSPDENHIGDNDLYTNLLAQWIFNGGAWNGRPRRDWQLTYHLPKDRISFLSYDNDPVRTYKQAAAVLSIYPLQYPPAEAQAKTMMDRFADKVIKNGPAMSDSVHALIWARLGDRDKAYQVWQDSWKPFTTQPLLLFSEKRVKPVTYFTTGAGGSLQTVLFGFLGFRLDSIKEKDADWSMKLQGNNWLSIKANFPRQWKSVKLRNFTVLGHKYTLTATHRPNGSDAAQVTQGD